MWEIVGFEKQFNADNVVTGISLHCKKDLRPEQGAGCKVKTFWYRPSSVQYDPVVGERVIIDVDVRGQYQIVTDIIPC